MGNISYFVTGPSLDGAYGIAVSDRVTGERAIVMHFLKCKADVEFLVARLNNAQISIQEFCYAALHGEFLNSGWLKSPG